MRLPGFSGEASLYRSVYSYAGAPHHVDPGTVSLASYVDQACLGRCERDCGNECGKLSNQERGECVHECARENSHCFALCTRSGSPPGSGSGTPSVVCDPGLTNCGGTCRNLSVDSSNCGSCGTQCKSGTCCGGACGGTLCPDRTSCCPFPFNSCVTLPFLGARCI
jgi:hypothetical protein